MVSQPTHLYVEDGLLRVKTACAGFFDFLWLHREQLVRQHGVTGLHMQWLGEDGKPQAEASTPPRAG